MVPTGSNPTVGMGSRSEGSTWSITSACFFIIWAYVPWFGVKTTKIKIEGMTCLNCAVQVQRALVAVPTVKFVGVSIGAATVEHENASPEKLLQAVRIAGDFKGEITTPRLTLQIPQPQAWLQKTLKLAMAKFLGHPAPPPNEAVVSEAGSRPAIHAGYIGQSRRVSPLP